MVTNADSNPPITPSPPACHAPGTLLGHEFHYSSAVEQRGTALFDAEDAGGAALGEMGLLHDNVSGSYGHIIAMA